MRHMSRSRVFHYVWPAILALAVLLSAMMAGLVTADSGVGDGVVGPAQEGTPSPTPTLPIGTYDPPSEPTVTAIPPYAPVAAIPEGHDVLNVLLLGSDTDNPYNNGRTDAIMIVSINRTAGTASLLSLPRDLFVYIPGYTMQRINTALGYGQQQDAAGGGYRLLADTIRYNLGIPIHFYARVDFNDFRTIIDSLGGVNLSVDCTIQDWRLIEPDLDPTLEESWELFTLPVGYHEMNGDLALWYARSRRTSSDFDRGRRQQDLMRGIWRRLRELGLLNQLPALWGQVTETVDTDMGLQDVLGLVPLALSIDTSHIAHYALRSGVEVQGWQTPGGASVQLPVLDALYATVYNFMQPPTSNRLVQGGATVEVLNASGYNNLDRVAADQLAWEGFAAVPGGVEGGQFRAQTVVYDYTGRTKGSALDALLAALRLSDEAVILEPDAERTVDYRVVLGSSYGSCTHGVLPPVATPTP